MGWERRSRAARAIWSGWPTAPGTGKPKPGIVRLEDACCRQKGCLLTAVVRVCLKMRAREKNKPITKHVCCIARWRTTIRFIKLLPLWQHHTPPSRPPPSVFLRIFRKLQHCGIKAKGPDLCALPSHINSRESIRIAYRIVSRRCASKVCARERKTIATADPHHHPSPFTHLHGRKNICGPIASPRWRCRRNTNAAVAAAVAAGRRVKEKHLKQLHTAAPI